MDVVIAGVGNVLRGDDGFGVAVAQRLQQRALPDAVHVYEIGIGGIHLVQRLMDRPDALIVIDALDRGVVPGTITVMRPDVGDVRELPLLARHDWLADMHYATPARALMLARGLGVLPEHVWIVGCQPADGDTLGEGLSGAVAAAVGPAIAEIDALLASLGVTV